MLVGILYIAKPKEQLDKDPLHAFKMRYGEYPQYLTVGNIAMKKRILCP